MDDTYSGLGAQGGSMFIPQLDEETAPIASNLVRQTFLLEGGELEFQPRKLDVPRRQYEDDAWLTPYEPMNRRMRRRAQINVDGERNNTSLSPFTLHRFESEQPSEDKPPYRVGKVFDEHEGN